MKKSRENPLVWLYKTPKNDFKDIVNTIDTILMKLGYEIRTLILSSKGLFENNFPIIFSCL